MGSYELLLFTHVLAAVVLVGGSLVHSLIGHRLKHAPSVAAVRAHAGVAAAISKFVGPSAAIILLAGMGLVFQSWSFGDGWIVVSLVLFAASGVLAVGVAEPVLKRLVAAADDAADGPVTPEVQALVFDPKLVAAHNLLLTVDIALVALMTLKPELTVSIGLAVIAIAAGVGLTLGERRRPAPASIA